jgi:uncharacterized membrane protein (DUF485 family)
MKGSGGGLTPEGFILYYTAFIMIVAYLSGLWGTAILTNVPAKPSMTGNTLIDSASNIALPFTYFLALLATDTIPEFRTAMAIIITPAVVVLIFIMIKHLPVIGSG